MDKAPLFSLVIEHLELLLQNAIDSANRAHAGATDKESIAENKYDTRGLEASYLAHGQAKRVRECEQDLQAFVVMSEQAIGQSWEQIKLGALVTLVSEDGQSKQLLLSPVAGGLKFEWLGQEVMLVTPAAPLGRAMQGLQIDDEFSLSLAGVQQLYSIESVT